MECLTHETQYTGHSQNDLLFTKGNGDISPDSDSQLISQPNFQSSSNSNETNQINLHCNDSNLQEDSHKLNLLECADENIITELLEVTDQYVCKMQIVGNIVPSNIQEGNEVVTFSHIMKFFGKF